MFREGALGTMAFKVDSLRGQMVSSYRTSYDRAGVLSAMPDLVWAHYTGKPVDPSERDFQPIWLYGPPLSIPTVPIKSVFDPETSTTIPEDLSDKVVFIGSSDPTDASINDHFPAPTSGSDNLLIGGVELAATAFLNLLHDTRLDRPAIWVEAGAVLLFSILGGMLILRLAGWHLICALAGLSLGWFVIGAVAFSQAGLWLPIAIPVFLITGLLVLAAISVRYLFVRRLVESLMPRQIAAGMLGGTSPNRRAVQTEPATIMFTDLVGSTGMAEELSEFAYSDLVSRYYDMVTNVIEAHDGMVVEFMGDGVLSLFSQSVTGDAHAQRCCTAARTLLSCIEAENQASDTPDTRLGVRIGINTGMTSTGDIGAERRFNFKALGDVVNVAARLELLAKDIGSNGRNVILISGTTQEAAGEPDAMIEYLGTKALRGRRDAVAVFQLRL